MTFGSLALLQLFVSASLAEIRWKKCNSSNFPAGCRGSAAQAGPNPSFCFLLESCATPGNFASVPVAARRAAGVLGAGTEGGNAAGMAGNGLWIESFSCLFTPELLRAAHSLSAP